MSDLEIKPLPGQDVVVISPPGTTLANKVSYNSTRTRARVRNTGTWVEPTPEPPPPTGKVVRFKGGASALVTLAKDLSVDVVELDGGTYTQWVCFLDVARPADRPLLIRPVPGAAVIFDGGGGSSPAFRIGWRTLASYVTLEGPFTIQNYALGLSGLVMASWFDHVAFNGVRVRNVGGTESPQTTHALYVSSANEGGATGHPKSHHITANGWDIVGPANRYLSGLHIYHDPNADHIEAKGWTVSSLHRAVYAYSDATNILIDGWSITDCNATIDNWGGTAQGVVSNCRAVRSGPIAPGQGSWKAGPLVSGGGNVVVA